MHLAGLRARVFVLHDRGDPYVPYTESVRLHASLAEERRGAFLLSALFEHAQPRGGLSPELPREVAALYGFLTATLRYL
jgi:hypothetical protein